MDAVHHDRYLPEPGRTFFLKREDRFANDLRLHRQSLGVQAFGMIGRDRTQVGVDGHLRCGNRVRRQRNRSAPERWHLAPGLRRRS